MPALTDQNIRELLLACWGRQTCVLRPADWPDVLARLMKAAPATPGGSPDNHGRGSLKAAVDEAVAALAAAFADGPPADPADAIWRAFPRLDRRHREELATALTEARHD